MEPIRIENCIEFQAIYKLCENHSEYIRFLEMLKELVNKILNEDLDWAGDRSIHVDVEEDGRLGINVHSGGFGTINIACCELEPNW